MSMKVKCFKLSTREFRYTGVARSLDNHESDYYESTNWIICVWNSGIHANMSNLHGEIESDKDHYHFNLENNIVLVQRSLESNYDGLGKRYIEGSYKFPVPKYVCDFIRSLKK